MTVAVIAGDLQALAVPTEGLVLLPGNPRRGDIGAVAASLAKFGQRKPIVVRRSDQTVVAGNHTLQAAQELGWSEIAVVWVDDDDATAKAFALADNRTADLGDYDERALATLIAEIQAADTGLLAATGWTDNDLADLLAELDGPPPGATDEDDAPPLPDEPATKLGDLWILGTHRLLCGDSTSADDVTRLMAGERAVLMATDPPYLVDYQGGNHPPSWSNSPDVKDKHWDDYIDPDSSIGFFRDFITVALEHALAPNTAIYQWFADLRTRELYAAWDAAGLLAHQQIIWVKSRPVLTRRQFMQQHEPALYGWKKGDRPARHPPANVYSVWPLAGECDGIHPTQKPVALFTGPIEWHSRRGEVVFEPFGGSGTQLIAAERLGRRCFSMELAPGYCDVICRRYQEHTGTKPVLEATGEPRDFSADG